MAAAARSLGASSPRLQLQPGSAGKGFLPGPLPPAPPAPVTSVVPLDPVASPPRSTSVPVKPQSGENTAGVVEASSCQSICSLRLAKRLWSVSEPAEVW